MSFRKFVLVLRNETEGAASETSTRSLFHQCKAEGHPQSAPMKGRILILVFWLFAEMSHGALSFLPATNEVNLMVECTSYDTVPHLQWIDSMASYVACMYPQYTNHIWSWSHSGSGLEGDFENDEGGKTMPFFHTVDTNLVAWNYCLASGDNGGYSSNQVVQWFTNIMKGPQQVWNRQLGALTNEPITFPTVIHLPIGCPPGDDVNGGGGNVVSRNNAATNLAGIYGLAIVDMWHDLWTNGVSTDVTGARLFGFSSGNHPYPAGFFMMGLKNLIALGAETNIGSLTFDWSSATASTNHCSASGINLVGSTLTATVHFDRMPGAWDVGDGTNGCNDAFRLMPFLANAFQWTIQVTNLPAGNYNVNIDGSNVVTLMSAQLASGWNMFAVTNGPLWNQRLAVLNAKRDQEGNDHFTLLPTHGAGDRGVGGNLDLINYQSYATLYPGTYTGLDFINGIAPYVAGMKALDLLIHNAAQQTNHVFTISLVSQTISFPSPGNQVYGVSPITLGATASSGLTVIYNVTAGPAAVSGSLLTITGPGSITIQATQPGNANWPAANPVSQIITVAQKTVTASITASGKIYDGTSAATIATRALTGVVGSDSITLSGGSATFPDKTIGVARTVTATGLALAGTDVSKYTLASTSATTAADITPATVTVAGVTAADKVYDGTTSATVSATNAVLSGIIGMDAVMLTGTASGVFLDSGAATGKTVTVNGFTLAGADANNYSLAPPTATASITKASTFNALLSSFNPAPTTSNITFSATLTAVPPGGGTPIGNVVFKDGGTILETKALNASGAAFLTNSTLSHGVHTITAEYSGGQNFFGSTNSITEVIDAPPSISGVSLTRYSGGGIKVRLLDLLTNAIDPDGDALSLVDPTTTTSSGATISTNAGWIFYQPPQGFTNSDVFSWTVADSFSLLATGSVAVVVIPDTNAPQNFASGPSSDGIKPNPNVGQVSPTIQFLGIPNRVYTIQYATNSLTPNWQNLGSAAADKSGLIEVFDDLPAGSPPRIYRTTYP